MTLTDEDYAQIHWKAAQAVLNGPGGDRSCMAYEDARPITQRATIAGVTAVIAAHQAEVDAAADEMLQEVLTLFNDGELDPLSPLVKGQIVKHPVFGIGEIEIVDHSHRPFHVAFGTEKHAYWCKADELSPMKFLIPKYEEGDLVKYEGERVGFIEVVDPGYNAVLYYVNFKNSWEWCDQDDLKRLDDSTVVSVNLPVSAVRRALLAYPDLDVNIEMLRVIERIENNDA